MKNKNLLDASKLYIGLNYGDHGVNAESVVEELRALTSGSANSFVVRCHPKHPFSRDTYRAIASFAKEDGKSFAILYAYQHPPKGERSHLSRETVSDIYSIAGDLFLGEIFAETGSQSTAQDEGYYIEYENERVVKPPQDFPDMHSARKYYVDYIRNMVEYDKALGIKNTVMVEPCAISAYATEGGIDVPILEVFPGNPEKLISFTRGAAIGYGRSAFGGFIAHEWYGGYKHLDALKKKRLALAYKYLFISGASYIFLESGNSEIDSFGYKYSAESDICRFYRETAKEYYESFLANPRPASSPLAKVAFVFGEDDGYSDFLGASSWCQFGREEWGKGDREASWRILDEVYRSPSWFEAEHFASEEGLDLGNAPAYGAYDVIPAASPLSVMENYSYLIFVGHNTMSEELYSKLCAYVRRGGILLASVAHLNTDSSRTGAPKYVNNGDFTELFGCRISGFEKQNHGVKFKADSSVSGLYYPGTLNLECDANYPSGYCDYARLLPVGAEVKAYLSDSFNPPSDDSLPVVCEYKSGKGASILLSHTAYPGNPAVYPIYKILVKALLTASHASCELKVFGSDKVRFSFYRDGAGKEVLYLLNTAFNSPSAVTVRYKGNDETVLLDACEMKRIDF